MTALLDLCGDTRRGGPGESGATRLTFAAALLVLALAVGIFYVSTQEPGTTAAEELSDEMHGSFQERTMWAMRTIATANATKFSRSGSYAETLGELEAGGFMETVSTDGWGNPFVYSGGKDTYTLTSYGSDGAAGPSPPSDWMLAPFDPDIVMVDNLFVQFPRSH